MALDERTFTIQETAMRLFDQYAIDAHDLNPTLFLGRLPGRGAGKDLTLSGRRAATFSLSPPHLWVDHKIEDVFVGHLKTVARGIRPEKNMFGGHSLGNDRKRVHLGPSPDPLANTLINGCDRVFSHDEETAGAFPDFCEGKGL